jgi:hypothetical protein
VKCKLLCRGQDYFAFPNCMCNPTVLDKITVENKKLPVKYKFHRREQYYKECIFCLFMKYTDGHLKED